MNRIEGLHPRTPGELAARYPAVLVPRGDLPMYVNHGHGLARALRARRMAAVEVGPLLGLHPSNVSRWLADDRVPAKHVPALARLLGTDPATVRSWFEAAA